MRTFLVSALLISTSSMAATFTGDVPTDFAGLDFAEVVDAGGVPDVGLPAQAPVGTISGFDFERVLFDLDLQANELVIGIDYFTIAGDADDDGGEGTTSAWLAGNFGLDVANLGASESICIAFDFDMNGDFDLIAGVPSGSSDATVEYTVADYDMHPFGINFSFGADMPAHNGGFAFMPDMEMAIAGIDVLDDIVNNTICFSYKIFSGSIQDDGVGEDLVDDFVANICITDDLVVEAVLPQSMDLISVYPNPFNPTTTLQVEIAQTGQVELAIFNLLGQQVSVLSNGLLDAGNHSFQFDASALPSGLYLARMATEQGVQVERLLLSR